MAVFIRISNLMIFLSLLIKKWAKDQKEVLKMAVKCSYETVMVFSVKGGEEKAQELKEKFKTMIEGQAEEVSMDDWGKRKLAYPINYETEGYYVLYNYKSNTDFPAELDRVLNITEGVLRSLIVKK